MIGQKLGHYQILEKIGGGGMGDVYRAHDEQLERDVAIKVLAASRFSDPAARPRLLREARAVAALNHPHVCTIYEVGEAGGQAYIAMELIEGKPLDRLIPATGLPVEQVLRFGLEIADAVAHAHDRGIVHRDLKPSNTLVTTQARVKVLDFGLAKRIRDEPLTEATTESGAALTQAGALVGTLPYMAPEQLKGQAADAGSDVWALGVVLYEMAVGVRPFRGQTGFELSSAILSHPPHPVPARVPVGLAAVIERCLEKAPARRYRRASEVKAALEAVQTGSPPSWPAWRYWLDRRRRLAWAGASFALVALVIGLSEGRLRDRLFERSGGPAAIKLAVLPFANLTGDPEQEYFSDGLTEEMIAQIGRLHPQRLGVIGRASVMRFKNTQEPIKQIGRDLGVDCILEGSVRGEAGRVRITAELVHVRNQTQLWAQSYERELAGTLAVQSDVAGKVAGALALTLLPTEKIQFARLRPVDPEAYEAYMKGLLHFYKLTPPDLDASLQYFESALRKDPNYALAHAGIAAAWVGRAQMGFASPEEARPKAKAAALKALELDGSLPEAHYWLAVVRAFYEWDFAGAEPGFQRALELNPNYADARATYSHFLNVMHRPKEAMAQIERALELDPLNALHHAFYAIDLLFVRRYDDAIAQSQEALKTAPGNPAALTAMVSAYHNKRMYPEALRQLSLYADAVGYREASAVLARGNPSEYRDTMRRAAGVLAVRSRMTFVIPFDVATWYAYAGDNDRVMEWLEKGYELRDPSLPFVQAPDFDGVRHDPRFQDLLGRMKLPS